MTKTKTTKTKLKISDLVKSVYDRKDILTAWQNETQHEQELFNRKNSLGIKISNVSWKQQSYLKFRLTDVILLTLHRVKPDNYY